jgi:GntR family transcriptional regulator
VENGRLRGGDRLPSVRDVVTQITINPNTVHRAYRELEYQGIAEGRTGLGTFITPRADFNTRVVAREELADALKQWTDRARSAGLSEDGMLDLIRRILNRNERVWS